MVEREAVADPIRAKRSHSETEGNGQNCAAVVSADDEGSKKIKLENNGGNEKPLQKTQLQVADKPHNAKPHGAARKQEDVQPAASAKATAKEETASTAQVKALESKPQALPEPAIKQSASTPQSQACSTSIKSPTVSLAPEASTNTTDVQNANTTRTSQTPIKELPPTMKARTFRHLHKKFGPELDYMLVEFKKLERQLLGAPIHQVGPPKAEPKGSRERREKLHGFITHLEDTIKQVEEGLALENQEEEKVAQDVLDAVDLPQLGSGPLHEDSSSAGEEKKSSDASLQRSQPNPQPNAPSHKDPNDSSNDGLSQKSVAAALSSLSPQKEREEAVHRLEEHILGNLLPVKNRLTVQLAAQKGATRNPLTAPVRAGAPAATTGGTIAEAVEAKRKAKEEELLKQQLQQKNTNHFGKPIGGARSSLTSRLHQGGVLGASASPASAETTATKRPILYAGVAPGSKQVSSSVSAVSGAHPGLVGKDATAAVSLAEEENRRMKALEENAARVALGGAVKPAAALDDRKPAAQPKQPEGPATLAARARAIALAAANGTGGASKISRPNQQIPIRTLQQHRPSLGAAASTRATHMGQYAKPAVQYPPIPVPSIPTKPKKPHVPPNLDDPNLTSEQKFELRMKEARWRQRKRRRERRRKRLEEYYSSAGSYHIIQVPIQQQALPPPPQPETQPDPIKSTVTPSAPGSSSSTATPLPGNSLPTSEAIPNPKTDAVFGPRTVEYACSICNEIYVSTCEFNPWWELSNHECPKCGKVQIPKIDISAPMNDIEYHPALLSQQEPSKVSSKMSNTVAIPGLQPTHTVKFIHRPAQVKGNSLSDSEVSFTDESDGEGTGGKYDESSEEEDTTYDNDMDSVTREDRAEREEFGLEFKGETLTDDQSRKLLVLIEHASICPGR